MRHFTFFGGTITMRDLRRSTCGFILLFVGFIAWPVRAEAPPDPLRFIPEQADLFVQIDNPRQFIEVFTNLAPFREIQKLQAVQEYYDSTNQRRLLQLIAYFEKELGVKWPEALDRLAGGGAVAALKLGPNPNPVGLVIQGKDPDLTRKFVRFGLSLIEGELARREAKERLEKSTYHNVEVYQVGTEFHAASVDGALLLANKAEVLHYLIDTHQGGAKSLAKAARVAQARQLLPAKPLAWMWLNLETVRQRPEAKEVFAQPRNDPILTVALGGLLDVVRRSSFLCGALYQDQNRLVATFRMPQGREGMPVELATHIPPADNLGALPLLEPKGVIFSSSSYFDLSKFWEYRTKLFNAQQVKTFEDTDKQSGLFLLGNRLSKLFAQAGVHQRFVVVNQARPVDSSKTEPSLVNALAFGLVLDTRDKGFARSMETILRGAGLIARSQVKLTLVEEKYRDVTIIGFRFPENEPATAQAARQVIAYLPTPSFVLTGDQFVVASSLDLCKELVDRVRAEAEAAPARSKPEVSNLSRLYAPGGAKLLKYIEDQLYAQTVLNQALSPAEAKEQVNFFIEWVRGLGWFDIAENYGAKDFRYDLIYAPK